MKYKKNYICQLSSHTDTPYEKRRGHIGELRLGFSENQ